MAGLTEVLLALKSAAGAGLIRFEDGGAHEITDSTLDRYLGQQGAALPPWPVRWPAGDLGLHPLFSFNPQEFEPIALLPESERASRVG